VDHQFTFLNSLYGFLKFYYKLKKMACIKEKLGLEHFKALEQFLSRTAYYRPVLQLPFLSFIYSCLDNKTDRIGRILKFTMETEAAVEVKRMYF